MLAASCEPRFAGTPVLAGETPAAAAFQPTGAGAPWGGNLGSGVSQSSITRYGGPYRRVRQTYSNDAAMMNSNMTVGFDTSEDEPSEVSSTASGKCLVF